MAARALWVILAAIHAVVLMRTTVTGWQAGSTAAHLGALALLLAATAFFVLKTIDLPALRWGCRRRGAVVFLIVCAVVHQDMRAAVQGHLVLAATITTVASAIDWPRVRRWLLERLLDAIREAAAPRVRLTFSGVRDVDDAASSCMALAGRASPRGPPA